MSDMPNTSACLLADRLGLRPTDPNTQCSWVCEMRMADQMAFYTQQSLLHATALPIHGLHLETEFHVSSFHGEIHIESHNRPQLNKQFRKTHTRSLTLHHSMSTNFEGRCFSQNTCMP